MRAASATASSMRSSTSRLSRRRVREHEAAPTELPVGGGDPRRGSRRRPRAAERAVRRSPSRRAAACPSGSRARGCRASRGTPSSPERRAATSRRSTRRAPARSRARRGRRTRPAETGKPRWTPPIPPVPRKRMPTRRATTSSAADRRRADVARDRARCEVARADLASGGREACELVLGQADADPTVEHADRRRNRARLANRARRSRARPRRRSGAGKPCATSVVSSATTGVSSSSAVAHLVGDAGSARSRRRR